MSSNGAAINVNSITTTLNQYISSGKADPTSNMENDKIYIYHGTADTIVSEGIVIKKIDYIRVKRF